MPVWNFVLEEQRVVSGDFGVLGDETFRSSADMAVDEKLLWRAVNAGFNVLVSGPAGSGKSHLLKRFISRTFNNTSFCLRLEATKQEESSAKSSAESSAKSSAEGSERKLQERDDVFRQWEDEIRTAVVTAPTGIAAYNITAETLHSRLKLGLAEGSAQELWSRIASQKSRYARTLQFLTSNAMLVIDEISMVHPDFFKKLIELRELASPGAPFQLVMFGDFLQLGPVFKKGEARQFVFQTPLWSKMNLARVWLQRSFRHDDPRFLHLLNNVRCGMLTRDDAQLLQDCQERTNLALQTKQRDPNPKKPKVAEWSLPKLEPLDVFPYKRDVEERNATKLQELAQCLKVEVSTFEAYTSVQLHPDLPASATLNPREVLEAQDVMRDERQMSERFPVGKLSVAVGAQVMLRVNLNVAKGLCNGTMGIVTRVEPLRIHVKFSASAKSEAGSSEAGNSEAGNTGNSEAGYTGSSEAGSSEASRDEETSEEDAQETTILGRHSFYSKVGSTACIVLVQFPVTLAWASTIHKVQGLTLDAVRVDAQQCFEAGQFYVAISRVRRLADLSLLGFDPHSVLVNRAAREFECLGMQQYNPTP